LFLECARFGDPGQNFHPHTHTLTHTYIICIRVYVTNNNNTPPPANGVRAEGTSPPSPWTIERGENRTTLIRRTSFRFCHSPLSRRLIIGEGPKAIGTGHFNLPLCVPAACLRVSRIYIYIYTHQYIIHILYHTHLCTPTRACGWLYPCMYASIARVRECLG